MCAKKVCKEVENLKSQLSEDVAGVTFEQLMLTSVSDLDAFRAVPKRGRRARRLPEERGLPDDKTIDGLARTYLEDQRRLWPEKVRSGVLPELTEESVSVLVEEFKRRFTSADPFADLIFVPGEENACCYSRYSSDNSNKRSLPQQLHLELEKAAQEKHFIPWAFVFADAAISGTTAARRGYEMAKFVLGHAPMSVAAFYIDETGRASRDMIEALTLGRMISALNKRLIGVSDGFDSSLPMAKVMLSIFAALQEWFIDQLRAKVLRGQDDAFRRGANTGLAAPGYKLVPLLDSHEREVLGADDEVTQTLAIDALTAKIIIKIFYWFAVRERSPEHIAMVLNRIAFAGYRSWSGGRVRELLRRHVYVGIKTYRMTRQVRDRTTNKVTVIKIPRKHWKVKRARHLQIVPYPLWKAAQRRLRELSDIWKNSHPNGKSRSEAYPTTLVRPCCEECKTPMIKGSSGKYATFCCNKGTSGQHGCKAKGYKSVRQVEETILSAVAERIISPTLPEDIASRVNNFLQQYASRPAPDVKPLENKVKQKRKELKRLWDVTKHGEMDLPGAREQLANAGAEIRKLEKQLREAAVASEAPPAPITGEVVKSHLLHLRDLLQGDVATAAKILKELTGPIWISQTREKGRYASIWHAKFTLDFIPVMLKIQRGGKLPTTDIWQFLNTRSWKMQQRTTVRVCRKLKVEILRKKVMDLVEPEDPAKTKLSKRSAAAVLGVYVSDVARTIHFAKTGELPKWPKKEKKRNQKNDDPTIPVCDHERLIQQIVALRDQKKRTFPWIARELGIPDERKVIRLYDRGRPDKMAKAGQNRTRPDRGRYTMLGEDTYVRIRQHLAAGKSDRTIAKEVGVGKSTVHRERVRMRHQAPPTVRTG